MSELKAVSTRERILQAAIGAFADKGFHTASIRDICQLASVNIAAVNYHFGTKEILYCTAISQCIDHALERLTTAPADDTLPPAERLERYIHWFLRRLLLEATALPLSKLMAHEMLQPTSANGEIYTRIIEPQYKNLCAIIALLLQRSADEQIVSQTALSIIGQCVFYRYCRNVLPFFDSQMDYSERSIEILAKHICRFSLSAVQGMAAGMETSQ